MCDENNILKIIPIGMAMCIVVLPSKVVLAKVPFFDAYNDVPFCRSKTRDAQSIWPETEQ